MPRLAEQEIKAILKNDKDVKEGMLVISPQHLIEIGDEFFTITRSASAVLQFMLGIGYAVARADERKRKEGLAKVGISVAEIMDTPNEDIQTGS